MPHPEAIFRQALRICACLLACSQYGLKSAVFTTLQHGGCPVSALCERYCGLPGFLHCDSIKGP